MAAEGTRLGTGFVSIEPDFSRFQELLGKRLSKALGNAKLGDRLGRELADELGARLSRSTRRSKGDMFGLADAIGRVERESRKAGRATKGLERDIFGVNRAAKDAGRKLRSARSELNDWQAGSRASSAASRNLTGRLRALGNEFRATARNARAGSGGFGAFNGGISRVNRGFQFFRNILRTLKWPLLIASVGLAAQGLSALAAGAVAASSAIGPLAGSLVALPAAALAAAQAISTLKLATAGVSDAIKASLDVQVQGGEQAVDTMRQQEDATERVADAKRNLISVERQAKFAQEDLTDARRDATRELEDMREAADRSHESEEQASLSLRQARAELNRTLNDVDASGLDIRIAEADVDRARADLTRTRTDAKRARQDFRDAQKSGVEGMPQVVAAKRAEADAIQAVKDAQRDYGRAVRDSTAAMEEQGSAATALQQKMAQLPAAARAFVREIVGLKPKLDALRATAASGFFPGATKGLRALLKNFGPVKGIVGETAEALGGLAERAGKQLGSAGWGKDLRKLGKGGTKTLNRMGEAAMNLADAFRHILVSAQPFLDWLGKSTVKLSEWIEGEAEAGRESGRLAAFFDRVRESMELMGPILKGVGGALLNIGEAARPVGNEILKSLGDAAEGWRDWTESTRGQNNLRRYFRESKPAIDEMGKLIRDIGKAFFGLGRQRGVAELLRLVRTELVPALTDLFGATTGFAADFLKQFGRLRREGMPTFEAFLVTLADKAGEAGGKMIRALWKAFWGASIWGKAAIGALLLSKFDALRGVLWGLGTRMGKRLGMAIIGRLAPTIAAEMAAGSKLGEILSTRMQGLGKRAGRRFAVGMAIGIATLAYWLGTQIGKTIPEGTRVAIKRWGYNAGENFVNALIWAINKGIRAINDKLDAVNALGKLGVDAPEIGEIGEVNFHSEFERQGKEAREAFEEGFIEGPGGKLIKPDEIPAPKTDRAREGYRKFNRDVRRGGVTLARDFREQLDRLPGFAERSGQGINQQMLPRLDRLADEGGAKGRKFAGRVGGAFTGLAGTARNAMDNIGSNLREALKALNVGKVPQFNLKKLVQQLPQLPPMRQRGGEVPALATGGLASVVPGNLTGDRHVLSLNGKPVARVESKEGIFVGNRKMMGALGKLNERFPRFQKGGLLGLQRGGYPMVSGDTDFLPALGFSLSKMARALSRSIFVQSGGRTLAEQAALYAAYQAGTGNLAAAPSPTAPHIRGVAADITPGSEVFGSAAGRFGMGFTVPGESWHIELLNAALGARGAGAAIVPKLKRLLLEGPKGPLKRLGQSAIDKVGDAAQKMLDKHASFGGGGGAWEQVLRQIAEARGWSAGDWMELVMRESGGDPSAVNPESGAYGLGQFLGSTKDAYAKYGAASPNGVDQIRAMGKYIADRYGTPSAALAFHDCVPLDTEILTRDGWKRHDEVQVGDETLAFNPVVGHSEWSKVTAIHVYDDAPLIELRNSKWHAQSTPNHRWVAKHWRQQGTPAVVEDVFVETERITSRHTLRVAAPAATDTAAITDDEAEILGWVLGDGHVTKTGEVRIDQVKPRYLNELAELLATVPHSKYENEQRGSFSAHPYTVHRWRFALDYGRDLLKRANYDHWEPEQFVLGLSPSQRERFLAGVFKAEGHDSATFSPGYAPIKVISQAAGPRADAITLAVYLSGRRPSTTRRAPSNGGKKDAVAIRSTRPYVGGEKLQRIPLENAPVWCVTTELGSWTARQDGQVMLTGNSHNWYKSGGLLKTARMKLGGLLGVPGLQAGGGDKGESGKRKFAPMQRHFERLKSLGLGGAGIAAFDSRRGMLSSLSEQAEQFSEWASNASALTFEDQAGNSIQGVFQGGTEGSWLLKQLSSLGELRNQLIVAREEFTALRERVEEMVARAKRQIEEIKRQIKRAQSKRSRLTHELRQARQNLSEARDIKDPKRREERIAMAQGAIASIGERITQLDFRQNQRTALQSWINDKTLPALDSRLEGVKAALTGTMDGGEGFIGLKQVHGIAGPMDQITGLSADTPPIGTLGGEILNVQARLRAIREEGKARAGSGDGDSEREGLLEELLRQANQRTAVSEAQKVALEGWDAMRQGYADRLPRFHTGGRIEAIRPGPGEVPLMAKVGESVLDEDDTRRVEEMAANGGNAGGVVIESIVIHEDGRATVRFEGREFEAAVQRVAKRNRPMGIPTAGGARR